MSLGKQVRLNRLFAHPSGRLCSAAIDHFPIYNEGLPPGLRHLPQTLAAVMAGRPDAVTLHKGMALALWGKYAGVVPLILQSSVVRPNDSASELIATPEDAIRLGADAYAIVAFLRGNTEAVYLRKIADAVREASRYELPVICHVYPRDTEDLSRISYTPEDIAWAVHCISEVGADVIKAPYCGDIRAEAQIVSDCPTPLVVAGGPKTSTLEEGLRTMADAMEAGVRGATIGRNIWGNENITAAMKAFNAVIHDRLSPREAIEAAFPQRAMA
jgi:class I fructose-bisphosphate aldolase